MFARPPQASAAEEPKSAASNARLPLAARMRPRALSEVAGQRHLLEEGSLLPRLIATDTFGSLLFYGPPGCGKTTLAEVIAHETQSRFLRLNAVLSNVAELRDTLRYARSRPEERVILFIDEIHRFNKAQQDLLLPDVEAGHVRLIGATTHNPGFYINPPLLSRSHLFKLEPVPLDDVVQVMQRALEDTERGLGNMRVTAEEGVLRSLAKLCDGDLRRALNALETLVLAAGLGSQLDEPMLEAFARERQIRYDADEDEHYDTASAFIKSMRGCDPDAALYWLAKMLIGGEDPRFIARRLVIFASEDVGMADPRALSLATATFQACEQVGMPECELNLAHCVVFLATAPKSNSTTMAIAEAKGDIRKNGLQNVPLWLRDAHTKLNKSFGHGKDYRYSHEFEEGISGQEFMEKPQTFYRPKLNGAEQHVAERLERWRQLKRQRRAEAGGDSGPPAGDSPDTSPPTT
ncbi:MAG: putative ATPase [Puniceicoccaceae bacterium 5H]|nr:MAG: putative ATPase [Puniceicoccaceae bacterium 5H]